MTVQFSENEFASAAMELSCRHSDLLETFTVTPEFNFQSFLDEIRKTPLSIVQCSDGQYATIEETGSADDFSKQSRDFYYHTDGLYHHLIPEIVILYCHRETRHSTETLLIDTRDVIGELRNDLDLLKKLHVVYIGKDKNLYKSKLIGQHPSDGTSYLSYGSRAFLMPDTDNYEVKEFPDMRQITAIGNKILSVIQSIAPRRFVLKSKEVLLFDNLRYIHARAVPEIDRQRKVLRLWLSRHKDKSKTITWSNRRSDMKEHKS